MQSFRTCLTGSHRLRLTACMATHSARTVLAWHQLAEAKHSDFQAAYQDLKQKCVVGMVQISCMIGRGIYGKVQRCVQRPTNTAPGRACRRPERGRQVERRVDGGRRRAGRQQQRRLRLAAVEAPRHIAAPPTLHQRAGKNGSDSLTGQSDPRSHPAHVYAPRVATVPRSSAGLQLWHAVRSTVMGVGRCELQDIKAALCVCCKAGVQAPRDPHLPRH